jgi:hypothetical protein
MRSVLVFLALALIVLATPGDARTVHHRTRHHVFTSPGAASSYVPSPGWGYSNLSGPGGNGYGGVPLRYGY